MDGLVANGTRGLDERVAVHWFSGSSGSMDQPPAFADWLCRCSLRPMARVWAAGVWAIDGLSRKAFQRHSSGVFPVVPGWVYRFLLDRTAHPSGVRSGSAGAAAGARFYVAGLDRAFRLTDAAVLWFCEQGAAQSSSPGFLSRILVTLLQPRVTRYRKSSTGI